VDGLKFYDWDSKRLELSLKTIILGIDHAFGPDPASLRGGGTSVPENMHVKDLDLISPLVRSALMASAEM